MTRQLTPLALSLVAAAALLLAMLATMATAPAASAAKCKRADVPAYKLAGKKARKLTLCLLNVQRKERGLKGLNEHKKARKAAKRHTRVMLKEDCFAHLCPGEPDLGGRFKQVGYTDCGCSWSVGENIAWGQGRLASPRKIVKAWMNSSGHRANILNRSFEHIGIAIKRGSPTGGSSDRATFTTTFGAKH